MLSMYKSLWEMYVFSSKVFHNMCNYINRFWVKKRNDENKPTLELYQVIIVLYIFFLTFLRWPLQFGATRFSRR